MHMNMNYLTTPENFVLPSQTLAKKALDQIKETTIWPEPYLADYQMKNNKTQTVFCWIFKAGDAQMILPAYNIPRKVQFYHKNCRLIHLTLGDFFLLGDEMYTICYESSGGYVVKRITCFPTIDLACTYAWLKYGVTPSWSLEYWTAFQKDLGVIWVGTQSGETLPDIVIPVWPEDKENFAGCEFKDIQSTIIPPGYSFEHNKRIYTFKQKNEHAYIQPADEPESLHS